MDAPVIEAAVEEAPSNVDSLPDATEALSFESSLEAAFANLDQAPEPEPVVEPEPVEDTSVEDTAVEDTAVEDTAVEESDDPIENLTDDIGDEWTPKAANRFKELKTELKTNRSELEQLRQQSKEYESKIQELTGLTESKDMDQMQEKLAQYEQEKALTNLEQTQAYKQAVSQPLEALVEQADQIADKYEVDSDALIDVLSLDDPKEQEEQLAELLPNASDRDKAKVYRIMEDIDPILQRRAKLYENADAALAEAKQLEEQQNAATAADNAQLRQNITKNVVERVQEKLPFLKGIEGLDMSTIQQKASETDPSVMHPVDHAYNAVSAQVFPTVVRQYLEMRKEVESLTDRLAEYEDAEPAMSGQTKAPSRAGVSENASFEERVNAALGAV
jgi:predicted ribosome quality control (RQC) complex YloA/Tae2 family protein